MVQPVVAARCNWSGKAAGMDACAVCVYVWLCACEENCGMLGSLWMWDFTRPLDVVLNCTERCQQISGDRSGLLFADSGGTCLSLVIVMHSKLQYSVVCNTMYCITTLNPTPHVLSFAILYSFSVSFSISNAKPGQECTSVRLLEIGYLLNFDSLPTGCYKVRWVHGWVSAHVTATKLTELATCACVMVTVSYLEQTSCLVHSISSSPIHQPVAVCHAWTFCLLLPWCYASFSLFP